MTLACMTTSFFALEQTLSLLLIVHNLFILCSSLQALKDVDLRDNTHYLRITVSNMNNSNTREKYLAGIEGR